MTWLKDSDSAIPAGHRLAELWRRPGILAIPGAHHGLGFFADAAGHLVRVAVLQAGGEKLD